MTPYSSDKEKYNANYWQWLKGLAGHFWAMPFSLVDDLLDLIQGIAASVLWIIMALTFPVSFPVIIFVRMYFVKKRLLRRYGNDILPS